MSPRIQEWRHRALAVVSEAVRAGCIDLVCHELRKVAAELPDGDARDRLQALELALLAKSLEGPVVLLNERSYREWAESGGKLPMDPVSRELIEGRARLVDPWVLMTTIKRQRFVVDGVLVVHPKPAVATPYVPIAPCFAWSAAENLVRDECSDATPGDQDWAGHCTDESGAPPVENGSALIERLREMARVVGVVAFDCCGEKS